jgi:hypothetical protein
MQVGVIWDAAIDPKTTAPALSAVLINLRQYLHERGFDKEKVVVNATTAQPNIVLLFRAEDANGGVMALLGQFKLDLEAEKGK